ncbi:MAG: BirA family transcriptional regulator biotin operon repressor / biotin-acetyl-CoA-carboxylase ligase [Bacillota bacterium]|nr:MAG: BirA family transcriptional regulator biotin operon repressor / biotin-acetyl-CoA-carboxylase ligase [Bacillota bacterium]
MHSTTRRVLCALSDGKEHSGEGIAVRLDISRVAVWKHISELRKLGYDIASAAGKGHKLLHSPNTPYEAEVHRYLTPERLGTTIIYVEECDSTNALLKHKAEMNEAEGTVIVANVQSAGRGRRGRTWLAQPGQALLFSVLLRPPLPPRELFGLTLMAGVAAVEALLALGFEAKVKWPNDILLTGKKVCGILAEVNGEIDHTNYVVLGIGLNVTGHPHTHEYQCTDLSEHSSPPTRAKLLAALLQALDENYSLFLQGELPFIFDKWRTYSDTLGRSVTAITPRGTHTGLAKDINSEGALVLELLSGEKLLVTAGEVSVRLS